MGEHGIGAWFAAKLLPPQPDPRLDAYPLMKSWTPTALISLAYVIGVYAWRAEIIKRNETNRKGRLSNDIKKLDTIKPISWNFITYMMVLYNLAMVVYSTYITVGSLFVVLKLGYGLGCVEQPDPNDKFTDPLVFFGYLYYISKFIELLDTVFFLWRGKVDQVTFLHVFHHSAMPPSVWWGLKYAPGGIVYTFPLVNSFIHIIMYTYYGLAAAGAYKYLWWKNYLTLAQMLQFLFFILHQSQVFLFNRSCNYPKVFPAAIIIYATLFLILFGNFYIKAYWRQQRLVEHKTMQLSKSIISDKKFEITNGYVHKRHHILSTSNHDHSMHIHDRKRS